MQSQELKPEQTTTAAAAAAAASFATPPARTSMPDWYPGRQPAQRESEQGWGSKVVTRLSADIQTRFPGSKGFTPRNLRYKKTFAQAWPEFPMLQAPLATLPWYHQIALLEKLDDAAPSLPSIELLEAELADEPANVAATGRAPAVEPERKL